MDELYTYDGANRLTNLQRGNVTPGSPPSMSSRNFGEDWVLDATGNCWWSYTRDQNGDYNIVPGDDLHRRFQNKANETTAIDKYMGLYGYPWADPRTTAPAT